MYFSYDEECGFDTWPTAEEAEAAAQECLEEYVIDAGNGWDAASDNVCWGKVLGVVHSSEPRPATEEGGGSCSEIVHKSIVSTTTPERVDGDDMVSVSRETLTVLTEIAMKAISHGMIVSPQLAAARDESVSVLYDNRAKETKGKP